LKIEMPLAFTFVLRWGVPNNTLCISSKMPTRITGVAFGNEPVRKAHTAARNTTGPPSKDTPFSPDEQRPELSRRNPEVSSEGGDALEGILFGGFGAFVTAVIKAKSGVFTLGRDFRCSASRGHFQSWKPPTRSLLLAVCAAAGVSIVSIEAHEHKGWGYAGMAVSLFCFAGVGASTRAFSKKIGVVEAWSEQFEEADAKIGLEELVKRQLALDEVMDPDERQKRANETMCV
jgi:hypothetical protein